MKQLKQVWLLNSQMSGNTTGNATGSADIPVGILINWERGHLARINSPLWRGGIEDDGVVLLFCRTVDSLSAIT